MEHLLSFVNLTKVKVYLSAVETANINKCWWKNWLPRQHCAI